MRLAWNRTKDDIRFRAKELYLNGLSGAQIAKILDCTDVSVYAWLEELGVERRPRQYHPKTDAILSMLRAGTHPYYIRRQLDVPSYLIRKIAKRNEISYPKRSDGTRTLPFNKDFFHVIDTEEKAYWLGIMSSDGFVGSDGSTFGVGLGGVTNPDDSEHVVRFRSALNSPHALTYDGMSAKLSIRNTDVVRDLLQYGITPEKSKTFVPILNFPSDLQRHFWRGMIDGDGCLFRDTRQSLPTWSIGVGGTYSTCDQFISFAKTVCDTVAKPWLHSAKSIWYIAIGGRFQVRRLADALYADCNVVLPRKYALYKQLVTECQLEKPDIVCREDDCAGKRIARGLCMNHYRIAWETNKAAWRAEPRRHVTWQQEVRDAGRRTS